MAKNQPPNPAGDVKLALWYISKVGDIHRARAGVEAAHQVLETYNEALVRSQQPKLKVKA